MQIPEPPADHGHDCYEVAVDDGTVVGVEFCRLASAALVTVEIADVGDVLAAVERAACRLVTVLADCDSLLGDAALGTPPPDADGARRASPASGWWSGLAPEGCELN